MSNEQAFARGRKVKQRETLAKLNVESTKPGQAHTSRLTAQSSKRGT
jgi:hypothetical protein